MQKCNINVKKFRITFAVDEQTFAVLHTVVALLLLSEHRSGEDFVGANTVRSL